MDVKITQVTVNLSNNDKDLDETAYIGLSSAVCTLE
jgi:hypothetical protein